MTKKRIYVPGYTRDGYYVKGHYRKMTEDKNTRSVAATIGWMKRKGRLRS